MRRGGGSSILKLRGWKFIPRKGTGHCEVVQVVGHPRADLSPSQCPHCLSPALQPLRDRNRTFAYTSPVRNATSVAWFKAYVQRNPFGTELCFVRVETPAYLRSGPFVLAAHRSSYRVLIRPMLGGRKLPSYFIRLQFTCKWQKYCGVLKFLCCPLRVRKGNPLGSLKQTEERGEPVYSFLGHCVLR